LVDFYRIAYLNRIMNKYYVIILTYELPIGYFILEFLLYFIDEPEALILIHTFLFLLFMSLLATSVNICLGTSKRGVNYAF